MELPPPDRNLNPQLQLLFPSSSFPAARLSALPHTCGPAPSIQCRAAATAAARVAPAAPMHVLVVGGALPGAAVAAATAASLLLPGRVVGIISGLAQVLLACTVLPEIVPCLGDGGSGGRGWGMQMGAGKRTPGVRRTHAWGGENQIVSRSNEFKSRGRRPIAIRSSSPVCSAKGEATEHETDSSRAAAGHRVARNSPPLFLRTVACKAIACVHHHTRSTNLVQRPQALAVIPRLLDGRLVAVLPGGVAVVYKPAAGAPSQAFSGSTQRPSWRHSWGQGFPLTFQATPCRAWIRSLGCELCRRCSAGPTSWRPSCSPCGSLVAGGGGRRFLPQRVTLLHPL